MVLNSYNIFITISPLLGYNVFKVNFMRIDKLNRVLRVVSMLICVGIVFYTFMASVNEPTQIQNTVTEENVMTWNLAGVGEVEFPYSYQGTAGEFIHVYGVLPERIQDKYGFMVQSLYSAYEVYVDGELIYEYGKKLPLPYGRMTGNIRLLIELNPDMAGKNIDIFIIPYYSQHMDLSKVTFGYMDSLKNVILRENLLRLCIVVFFLAIMLVSLVLVFYQVKALDMSNAWLYAHFVFFVFVTATWIVCSSDLPQFITDCNEGVSLISFLCLSTIAIPYMGFCEQVIKGGKTIFIWMQFIGWFLPLINIWGFCLNIYDPLEVLILSHIYIGTAAALSLIYAIKEFKSGKESRILLAAVLIVIISVAVGLYFYYTAPSQGFAATFVGFGMVAFIGTLFSLVLYRQVVFIRERKYLDTYRELAYRDLLTGLGNRSAFEKTFDEILKNQQDGTPITLFMFDLNFLKKVNDEEGHPAGDRLIIGMANCLQKTFKTFGATYRLGGDEFAALITGSKKAPDRMIEEFDANVAEYNERHETKLSVSRGYYLKALEKNDSFMQDVYRFADQAMYADKQRNHLKRMEE